MVRLLGTLAVGMPFAAYAQGPPHIVVFAAADLAFAFKEIVPLFERATGARVTLTIGSTGMFAQQIVAGAPADVFFAANESFLDDLIARGRVVADTRMLYAQGRIVLASRAGGVPARELGDLLTPRIRRVAIANPAHAPYGKAAEQALRNRGLWDEVKPKLVYGQNIRHTLQFIESGAADAGIVALSVANVPGIDHVIIDRALHEPLNQVAGVVATSRQPEHARRFIEFVVDAHGRPIMKKYGFLLPGDF